MLYCLYYVLDDPSSDLSVYCVQCNRTISRPLYEVHERRHNNIRPFCCEISTCDWAFCRLTELQAHVRVVHDKQRPFKCIQCDKRFSQNSGLKSHVSAVHNKLRLHSCPYWVYANRIRTNVSAPNVSEKAERIRKGKMYPGRMYPKRQNVSEKAERIRKGKMC